MAIRAAAAAFAAAVLATVVATPRPAGGDEPVRYVPPVDAPVVDAFRPPELPYGPGNRGLTYELEPGTAVRASADGEVVFAGPVAGTLHVTVLHADGLRTSYSFLDAVGVRRGQQVRQGEVVGTGGSGFHLGARAGDAYLDPAALFGGVEVRVRLVAHEEPLPPTDAGLLRERIALVEKVRERGLFDRLTGAAVRAFEIAGAGLDVLEQLRPSQLAQEIGTGVGVGLTSLLDCTRGGRPAPAVDAGNRIGVLVAGHGSTSGDAAVDDLDLDALGYDAGAVLRFSYGGGRVPDARHRAGGGRTDPALAGIPVGVYDETDTWGDLGAEGRHLADLIEQIADARPGAPIDVYGHSQGGIVTRLALLELADRGRTDVLGQVVTMGTPHQGAELATGAQLLDGPERATVEWIAGAAGAPLHTGARSVQQMAEGSATVLQLRVAGIPDGVRFRTIGARGDLVVTADKTTVDGHPSAVLDLAGPRAHLDIPGSAATAREVALAIAGEPPTCPGFGDILLDATVPELISATENALIAGFAI